MLVPSSPKEIKAEPELLVVAVDAVHLFLSLHL
jgi:hypothetical protein